MMRTSLHLAFVIVLLVLPLCAAFAQEEAAPTEEAAKPSGIDEELRYLRAEKVTTATLTEEDIEKSGAAVTVITQDEIRRMGARDVFDILRVVPGIGLTTNTLGMTEVEVRGAKSTFSEKVLMLVDGHVINNQLTNGGFQWGYDTQPVYNIKRVEVVRGPGSAIYGANAFVAVVNVITMGAEDHHGIKATARKGTFGTHEGNVFAGADFGQFEGLSDAFRELDVSLNANFHDSDGYKGYIEEDAVGRSGRTWHPKTRIDLDGKVEYMGLSFHGRYARREAGAFAGYNILTDDTWTRLEEWFLELKYEWKVTDTFKIIPRLYYDQLWWDNDWEIMPHEVYPPIGMHSRDNRARSQKWGTDIMVQWEMTDNNTFVGGASAEHQKQDNIQAKQNFDSLTYAPWPEFVPVEHNPAQIWAPTVSRDVYAGFAEDIWDITDDLRLILGARLDHYGDFGDTFNPRTSLIWEFVEGYHLRGMYGSAFRAPTFGELYNRNNPALVGNPGLDPEEIDTVEAGLSAQITDRFHAGITVFHNSIENVIVAGVPIVNSGEIEVTGIELETRYDFFGPDSPFAGTYVAGNYTFQDADNVVTTHRAADVPEHRANLFLNIGLPENFNLYTHVLLKASTAREVGDPREDDVSGYGLVNVALTAKEPFGVEGLEFRIGVFNLLDKDYVDPSPIGATISDYPVPGRHYSADISWSF